MMVFNDKCGDVGSFAVRSECEEGGKEFSLHFLYKTLWSMEIYRGVRGRLEAGAYPEIWIRGRGVKGGVSFPPLGSFLLPFPSPSPSPLLSSRPP